MGMVVIKIPGVTSLTKRELLLGVGGILGRLKFASKPEVVTTATPGIP
jgi:hypothetical protein